MERKPISLTRTIGPVNFYLDELRAITEIIEAENGIVTVTLSDKIHEYVFKGSEEISEIEKLPRSVFHKIKINSYGNLHCSIDLYNFEARIYIAEDSVKGRGIAEKTIEILKPRNKTISLIVLSPILPVVFMVLGVKGLSSNYDLYSFIVLTLSVVWLFCVYLISFKKYCTLNIGFRHDLPSFWVRKKDDLFLAAISGVIGAIFGAIAMLALK